MTKPAVKTLAHHHELVALAEKHNVLVMVEFHKRFDPIYLDAVGRIRKMGDFSFFNAFMSQPKFQLEVRVWCGDVHGRVDCSPAHLLAPAPPCW